jgi:hypothetical protein
MKKRKPLGPALAGQKQSRTGATENDGAPSSGPAMIMPHGAPRVKTLKTRGRLNRAVLAMLGKGLEDCFDEVRKQEVPERFKLLLQQF